jgi:hypothetical protein
MTTAVAITGNTYPHRMALRSMGGEWDGANKAWMVPADKADEARALVSGGSGGYREPGGYRGRRVSNYARFSSGAVVYTNRRGRCEDAPCCGCCS